MSEKIIGMVTYATKFPRFYPYYSLLLTNERLLAVPLSLAASLSNYVPQDPQQKANKILEAYGRVQPYGLPAMMIRAKNWGKLKEEAGEKRVVVSGDIILPEPWLAKPR